MDDDPYGAATAEFYELLATAHWARTGPELVGLLAGVDPGAGPVVDIGSGSGIALPYLIAAVPEARVLAIEPSRAMRVALHTRLLLDPTVSGRVTVDPRPLGESLPERASALVLSAVLGHLDDEECATVWRFAADRMPPGAPAVVEVLPPHRPEIVEAVRYAVRPVGDFVYEGWQAGTPVGEREMEWTMTYRVLDASGSLVAEHVARSTYRCWSPDDVRAAVGPFGLVVDEHGDAVVLRAPTPPNA
ncbi:MAG: class I SAM-dependent methyltransferase [Ilumatobacteraceae bacterium]